jgi:hypothetical protein
MLKLLRHRLILLVDWFDDTILRHRFYRLCQFIGGNRGWIMCEHCNFKSAAWSGQYCDRYPLCRNGQTRDN